MRKRTILIAIAAFLTVNVWGQTQINTSPIWYTNDNVGIGTTSPDVKLHVNVDNIGIKSNYAKSILEAVDAQFDIISSSDGTWGSAINFIEGNGLSNTDNWTIVRQTTGGVGNSSLRFNYGSANNHMNPNIMTMNTNGNVGIGTTSPNNKLDVIGSAIEMGSTEADATAKYSRLLSKHYSNAELPMILAMGASSNGVNDARIGGGTSLGNAATKITFWTAANSTTATGTQRMIINNNGNVGIGTSSPKTKLHIGNNYSTTEGNESIRISTTLGAENSVVDALHIDPSPGDYDFNRGVAIALGYKSITYGDYTSRIVHFSDAANTRASKMQLQTHSSTPDLWNTGILIDDIGNVGIGTTAIPSGYKLAIDGKVICEEVKVEMSDQWADFVFESNYNLMPLKELDNYIQENKHLPEIPTTAEVQENGISVGEMNAKLLQKIEELTLYVIELQKKNEEQDKIILELQNN